MLIEFTVGNYRSFRAPQTLSMLATALKSMDSALDENTVIKIPGSPSLLTSTALYGANASGKSNLVQAIEFMRSFVRDSLIATTPTGGIEVEPFRLSTSTVKQPSLFEVVFIDSGKRYRYGFEVTKERVVSEWLFFVPTTREARLFERNGDEIVVGNYFKEARHLKEQTRPNALFVSVAAQFNNATAQRVVNWFRRLGIMSGVSDLRMLPFTVDQLLEGDHSQSIRKLICRLDLGIADLQAEKSSASKPKFPDGMPEDIRQALITLMEASEGEAFSISVNTIHHIYDDEGVLSGQELFDLREHESEGTQKLFAMSGPLLDTLRRGDILIVDELDARLHPLVTREIIKLFNDKNTNPNGAQLVFNTQDTNLLDNRLFRRDQIWFVEKDQHGASHLYSLADFKVRNDKDYERGYIQGRFGAIPYLSHVRTIIGGESVETA